MSQSRAEKPPPPSTGRLQFTLAHWFCWLSVTAVLLFIHRNDARHDILLLKVQGAVDIITCPLYALGICGAVLAIAQRLRHCSAFPVHPGDWMLLWVGAYAIVHESTQLALQQIIPKNLSAFSPEVLKHRAFVLEALAPCCAHASALAVIFIAILHLSGLNAWRFVFLTAAIAQAGYAAAWLKSTVDLSDSDFGMRLAVGAELLLVCTAIAALLLAGIELIRGIHRSETHWLGIVTGFAPIAHALVFWSPLPFL